MGRFCGGCASLGKLWSEIRIKTLAPAIAARANRQFHQDRDSLSTIQPINSTDIKKLAARRQTVFDALTFGNLATRECLALLRGAAIDSVESSQGKFESNREAKLIS
jgi:hypothetical protein